MYASLTVNGKAIAAETLAMKKAGITAAACVFENTCLDTPEHVAAVIELLKAEAAIDVFPIAAITKNREGKQLAEMLLMRQKGVVAFSDGHFIADENVMKKALQYSAMLEVPLIIGSDLSINYDMNEGYYSTILGLKGSPAAKEAANIYRDLSLIKQYGGKVHFSHLSCKEAVDLIREAKQQGLNVSCGTAPHYLYLTEADVDGYDTNTKVAPPFRTAADRDALIDGLKDGTIDVLQSQHQPLSIDAKRTDFSAAKFGVSGVDLFLGLIFTKLHHEQSMDLFDLLAKFTLNPARILNLKLPGIALTNVANFTVVDLELEKVITAEDILSNGKNTLFIGKMLKGWATACSII
jgi:dihydroorotase